MKPAHIIRFENLMKRGRVWYLLSTALSVMGLIAAIQYFNAGTVSPKMLALYALVGAAIAQVDWLILQKRYTKHNNP